MNERKVKKNQSVLSGKEHNLFSFLSLIVLLSWKVVKYVVIFIIILLLISIILSVVYAQKIDENIKNVESGMVEKKIIIVNNDSMDF